LHDATQALRFLLDIHGTFSRLAIDYERN